MNISYVRSGEASIHGSARLVTSRFGLPAASQADGRQHSGYDYRGFVCKHEISWLAHGILSPMDAGRRAVAAGESMGSPGRCLGSAECPL